VRLYPELPARRFATIGHDLLLLLLLVLLAWLGVKVHDAVDKLAVLGSGVKKLGDLAAERYDPLVAAALEDAGLRARSRPER